MINDRAIARILKFCDRDHHPIVSLSEDRRSPRDREKRSPIVHALNAVKILCAQAQSRALPVQ